MGRTSDGSSMSQWITNNISEGNVHESTDENGKISNQMKKETLLMFNLVGDESVLMPLKSILAFNPKFN